VLLPGSLDVPLAAVREAGGALHVLSNACTHRGHLLLDAAGPVARIRCRYHGRSFGCDGRLAAAPGFEGAAGFPAPEDHLPRLRTADLGPFALAALPGAPDLARAWGPLLARLAHVPLGRWPLDVARSHDYEVDASWIAYVDNYLEGLHIPFVHGALRATLDLGGYLTEVHEGGVLQIGAAAEGELAFRTPDPRRPTLRVAAYYAWFWPHVMLNIYPWGLSLNLVEPLGPRRTRVRFRSYVAEPALLARGAGAALHATELEDEAVVARVQRGVRSPLYRSGRLSPSHEQGVHAFHRLLAAALG
jgi:choline monooxygenase